MTPTQQDRELAERIVEAYLCGDKNDVATLLAEAREAQHKASWAMAIEAAANKVHSVMMGGWMGARATNGVIEAVKSLPTPPITNEGE